MLSALDYALWAGSGLLCCYIVILAVVRGHFLRYFSLNLYVLGLIADTVGGFLIVRWYGFASLEYRFFYYFADVLLTILLYLVILGFFLHVFSEMQVARHLRVAAGVLLGLTAGVSYWIVHDQTAYLTTRFVIELSQNLYFLGVLLTWLLWGAVLKLHAARTRIVHLVLSIGCYFSAYALTYALRNLLPGHAIWRMIPPILGFLLALAWAYTFTFVPEEARMMPSRVRTRLAETHR
ncbi:MAG: hypothetical protein HY234_11840 [Acidobacteria bacterium]|nr:hypothetical protein [Acidobacteriota bacterium]MBI3663722.1 hypothetical protein [Acidobacteriota bacterium]